MAMSTNFGIAELARLAGCFGGHHLAAQLLRHGLHAVANTQHRNTKLEDYLRSARRIAIGDRIWAAGQDNPLGSIVTDEFFGNIVRMNFAEHLGFADASGDQLGNLGAEIENKDFLVGHYSKP